MRLISATLRNYRIHREVSVELDPARTLIGGANETGKSTLIEAIHRGLFLKSTVTGAARQSMVSSRFPGHPEVELRLQARGAEYQVTKRFAGASGSTGLVEVGGASWHGEDAESRLAQLLGVTEVGGGRGILARLSEQWAHLWVWQGVSGDDPSQHAEAPKADLLAQLQQVGGAVAMQSDLDGRVAARFAEANDDIFVRSGKARAGSELDKAQTDATQAEADHAEASARLDRLHQAMADFEAAEATIREATTALDDLAERRKGVNDKLAQTEALRRTERDQSTAVDRAQEQLSKLEDLATNIERLRESIRNLETSLQPRQAKVSDLQSSLAEARKQAVDAGTAFDRALRQTRQARFRHELAVAHVSRFERAARAAELRARVQRVQALQTDIADTREQLARLPDIDQQALGRLQKRERTLAEATAALNAMAAEVEVVVAEQPVLVGDTALSAGASRTLTETTDIKVGDALCLRIHPGGGDSLASAREALRTAREGLQADLDAYGVASVVKAADVFARRSNLQSKVAETNAALKEQNADALVADLATAEEDLTAAEAEVARRKEQVADAPEPTQLTEARAWREQEQDALRSVESNEQTLKSARDTRQRAQTELEAELTALRAEITEDERQLTGAQAQLQFQLDEHGDDAARAKALDEARAAKQQADAALANTRADLARLQPELLESDRERLQRALDETERQRQQASTTRAVSEAALRSDGAIDPTSALDHAQARLAAANAHLEAVNRKARAIALVNQLFQDEQRALADQFSEPLARKISGYLQSLFGADAEAVVAFEDNRLQSIALVRSAQDAAESFDALSGGTREQVAAAVRLAIAELLSADHDNTLPVVFDDAFAYSDPERVQTLQRMLDLGASRGLQIIVLSCNPADYAALGARQVNLKPSG
jgi:DNA repair exonuclease SbcCD ATPase subunit